MAEVFTNLARSTLASGIAAGATSLTVATGDGNNLFPALSGSDTFRCVLFKKATGDIEIVNVTARSGDNFTISRAVEAIGNLTPTAYAFNAGDLIELRPTAGFFASLGGITSSAIQSYSYNFGVDSGSGSSYQVALTPAPASYASPGRYMFIANTTATGGFTQINFNGLGAKTLWRPDNQFPYAGDIVAGKIVDVAYDGTDFVLMNPRSTYWITMTTSNMKFTAQAYFTGKTNHGTISTATRNISWPANNKQEITMANNITFTFTAPNGPTNTQLVMKQDAVGSRIPTWPANVDWPGGVAPSWSTAPNAVDVVSFYYDGSRYYGMAGLTFS